MTAYRKPPWLVVHVFNPIMGFLIGSLGLDLGSKRVLEVRGRTSGEWRSVPVNLLILGASGTSCLPEGRRTGYETYVPRPRAG